VNRKEFELRKGFTIAISRWQPPNSSPPQLEIRGIDGLYSWGSLQLSVDDFQLLLDVLVRYRKLMVLQ
jgi:hypothetical protein